MRFNYQPLMNADGGAPEGGATPETTTETKEESVFTPEQQAVIDKMMQSAQDKVRTEYSKKLKAAEDAKTALEREKMTEAEKLQAEKDDYIKQLEAERNEANAIKLQLRTMEILKENELPSEFKEFVTDVSEEKITEKVNAFKQLWQSALKTAVENKFKESGRTPHATSPESGAITKEQFQKMSYTERNNLFQTNRELYNQLSK